MKFKILILILLVIGINAFSQSEEVMELTEYSGQLKQIGGSWFLNTGEDIIKLSLAPEDFLKENNIELASQMELTAYGKMSDDEFAVHSLVVGENEYKFRDETGKTLWKVKPYKVIENKCIGCRLCVPACPQDAITMVKGIAVIDADKCDGDGICVNGDGKGYKGCPVGAIEQTK